MFKKYLSSIFLLTLFISPVVAQEKGKEPMQPRCEIIQTRIQNRHVKFEENKGKYIESYKKLMFRLNSISTVLNDKGFDTSKLEVDIDSMDKLVQTHASKYVEFVDSVSNLSGHVCDGSSNKFGNFLGLSKDKLEATIQDRKQIKEFYTSVIREDLKDLREQAREAN